MKTKLHVRNHDQATRYVYIAVWSREQIKFITLTGRQDIKFIPEKNIIFLTRIA